MPYTSADGKAIYLKNLKISLNMSDSDANQEILDKQAEAFAKSIEEILPLILVTVSPLGLANPAGKVEGIAFGKLS
ncbi:hypothetical protein ACWNT8_15695 (plasmid) [Pigmentibacter ruber]|nr:hypothetical protein GTC16762_32890 [Pigmentibacter ruber]